MGNESSSSNQYDGCITLGYRVLGVQPDSPASRAGLVSFFDFLVGVNGQLLFDNGEHNVNEDDGGDDNDEYFEDIDFVALLKDNVDKEIELLVWNIKSQTQRFILLTPTTNWPGTGLLGVTIRMDDYTTAEEKLLRILAVEPRSPAALCGLTPLTDYLFGTAKESFENEEVLGEVLEDYEDEVLEVYVYNTESDVVRVVSLVPGLKWGGRGLLGAEVGRGYLHRLPQACRKTLGVSFERKVFLEGEVGLSGENSSETGATNVVTERTSSANETQTESEKENEVHNLNTMSENLVTALDLDEQPPIMTKVKVEDGLVTEAETSARTVHEDESAPKVEIEQAASTEESASAFTLASSPMKFPTSSIPTLDMNLSNSVLGDLPPPPIAFVENESGGIYDEDVKANEPNSNNDEAFDLR